VRETTEGDDTFLLRVCPLRAEIAAPRVFERGKTVTFHGVAEGGVPGYTYTWQWFERENSTGPTTDIRFEVPGDYLITLTVTDTTGTQTTTTFTITVFEPGKQRRRSVRK
jgi:hypothetical protein